MRTKLLALAGLLLVTGWPTASRAAPDPIACRLQAASLMDMYLWPAEGGDNDFFTKKTGSTPNLVWILDNSCSMRDMPHMPNWHDRGCSDSTFNSVGYATYQPTCDSSWNCTYNNPAPDYDPTVSAWGGHSGLFVAGTAYSGSLGGMGGSASSGELGPISSVCGHFGSYKSECLQCIYTKGYYDWYGEVVGDGNFFNIYPPKYVIARRVFKDVLMDPKLAEIRMGLMDYSGWIVKNLNPSCNLADASATPSNFDSNRKSLSMKVESMDRAAFHTGTPLANTLTHAEEYYTYPGYFQSHFGSGSVYSEYESKTAANDKSVCWSCQFNAIGVITDGLPSGDGWEVPSDIKNVTSTGTSPQCPTCGSDLLPRVAWWFFNHDVRSDWSNVPEPQHVSVFTIGFGLSVPLLDETAAVSGGQSYTGDNATELEKAMGSITKEVAKRAITFTSANLSQVQSSATQSVFVPKLLPRRDGPWYGRLFRFRFISEFALGVDLNGDGQQNALFLVDKDCPITAASYASGPPAGCAPVRAANETDVANSGGTLKLGEFYKTTGFYKNTDTATDPNYVLTSTAANPVWEASDLLGTGTSANGVARIGPDQRRVYTVVDGNTDGKLQGDDRIPFDESHLAALRPYLDLTDKSPFCSLWISAGVSQPLDKCAQGLVAFVLGCTYGSLDPTTCTQRPDMLGDIFHSQPVLVAPPTPASMMNTPLRSPQDLLTLSESEQPMSGTGAPPYTIFSEGDPNNATAAYLPYKDHNNVPICHRNEFVLVGGNDGMLHAFDAGHWQPGPGATLPYTCHSPGSYDEGTGQELWAFIPPDLLPKLQYFGVAGFPHQLFVDGSPWVRDVWVDGIDPAKPWIVNSPDHHRSADEYRTLVVVGERRGGHHYFALDVTDGGMYDSGTGKPDYQPVFLWLFPRPGHKDYGIDGQEEVQVGESWNDTAQLPPPIGPIRYATSGGMGLNGPSTPWDERWIVAVGGGYDPHQARGRGFFFLDAWTGKIVWNFTRSAQSGVNGLGDPTSTSATAGVRKALKYSFAAAPALTGWGDNAMLAPGTDGAYYDTLVDGDTGGQLWVARFHDPSPAKWSAGRLFMPTGKNSDPNNERWQAPFFETPSLTWMPESALLRTYIGSGNRAQLRDRAGGTCSVNDPMVCALSGQCDHVDLKTDNITIDTFTEQSKLHTDHTASNQENGVGSGSLSGASMNSCPDLDLDVHTNIHNCNRYSGPAASDANFLVDPKCHYDSTKNAYTCDKPLTDFLDPNASDPDLACVKTDGMPPNRFYSVRVFNHTPFDDPTAAGILRLGADDRERPGRRDVRDEYRELDRCRLVLQVRHPQRHQHGLRADRVRRGLRRLLRGLGHAGTQPQQAAGLRWYQWRWRIGAGGRLLPDPLLPLRAEHQRADRLPLLPQLRHRSLERPRPRPLCEHQRPEHVAEDHRHRTRAPAPAERHLPDRDRRQRRQGADQRRGQQRQRGLEQDHPGHLRAVGGHRRHPGRPRLATRRLRPRHRLGHEHLSVGKGDRNDLPHSQASLRPAPPRTPRPGRGTDTGPPRGRRHHRAAPTSDWRQAPAPLARRRGPGPGAHEQREGPGQRQRGRPPPQYRGEPHHAPRQAGPGPGDGAVPRLRAVEHRRDQHHPHPPGSRGNLAPGLGPD